MRPREHERRFSRPPIIWPEFKCLLLGNAESREDPHGRFSEPLGGWISVDPDSTEQWETRGCPASGNGVCVFFDGRKSPAITEPGGERKYPFLINQKQINDALAYLGSPKHPRFRVNQSDSGRPWESPRPCSTSVSCSIITSVARLSGTPISSSAPS
jgi:hypothetical protein